MKSQYATLDLPFELKSLTDAGELEGYAAVFGNVDLGGDLIHEGAFTKTIAESGGKVPILWQHDRYEPIGVSTHMEQDRKGLLVKGQLDQEVQRGREARSLLQLGAFQGLSIGYKAVKPLYEAGVRHLKELALKEFSPVVFPMNDLAVASVKSLAGEIVWDPASSAEEISDAIEDALNPPGTWNYWVCDISRTEDLALVCSWLDDDPEAWVVPFALAGDGTATVAPSSEWTAAEMAWVADSDDRIGKSIAAVHALRARPGTAAYERGRTALKALLEREPAHATRRSGAARKAQEPALATLAAELAAHITQAKEKQLSWN